MCETRVCPAAESGGSAQLPPPPPLVIPAVPPPGPAALSAVPGSVFLRAAEKNANAAKAVHRATLMVGSARLAVRDLVDRQPAGTADRRALERLGAMLAQAETDLEAVLGNHFV